MEATHKGKSLEDLYKESEEKKRTLFVANIPSSTTRRAIKRAFVEFGTIEAVYIRLTPVKQTKSGLHGNVKSMRTAALSKGSDLGGDYEDIGSCFNIRFKEQDDAKKAYQTCLKTPKKLDGRILRVTLAEGTPEEKGNFPPSQCLFIGNVPKDATDDDIFKPFAPFGALQVRVPRDLRTRQGKGVAFILFASRDARTKALERSKRKVVIKGRELRLWAAQDEKKRQKRMKKEKKKAEEQRKMKRKQVMRKGAMVVDK
ncbi:hypothetical protein ADUPG1_010003 [Aduncisulcus paluster]|uniref:RRM domain-containing protein n=1 Tax=Aduncisulcus paluster TaxID=2918883 RepID=A0ABQ5KXJ0_9EUKA|nr:hypothetical protein ADUPG1_010003 [Aduncisulcus paluster]